MNAERVERIVEVQLIKLGVPPSILGFNYLKEAVVLCLGDDSYKYATTRRLYPAVAEKYGSTMSRVERAIRHAVEVACDNCDVQVWQSYFGNVVSPIKGKPTNTQAIAMIALHLKEQLKHEPKVNKIMLSDDLLDNIRPGFAEDVAEAAGELIDLLYQYAGPCDKFVVSKDKVELLFAGVTIPIELRDCK